MDIEFVEYRNDHYYFWGANGDLVVVYGMRLVTDQGVPLIEDKDGCDAVSVNSFYGNTLTLDQVGSIGLKKISYKGISKFAKEGNHIIVVVFSDGARCTYREPARTAIIRRIGTQIGANVSSDGRVEKPECVNLQNMG